MSGVNSNWGDADFCERIEQWFNYHLNTFANQHNLTEHDLTEFFWIAYGSRSAYLIATPHLRIANECAQYIFDRSYFLQENGLGVVLILRGDGVTAEIPPPELQ